MTGSAYSGYGARQISSVEAQPILTVDSHELLHEHCTPSTLNRNSIPATIPPPEGVDPSLLSSCLRPGEELGATADSRSTHQLFADPLPTPAVYRNPAHVNGEHPIILHLLLLLLLPPLAFLAGVKSGPDDTWSKRLSRYRYPPIRVLSMHSAFLPPGLSGALCRLTLSTSRVNPAVECRLPPARILLLSSSSVARIFPIARAIPLPVLEGIYAAASPIRQAKATLDGAEVVKEDGATYPVSHIPYHPCSPLPTYIYVQYPDTSSCVSSRAALDESPCSLVHPLTPQAAAPGLLVEADGDEDEGDEAAFVAGSENARERPYRRRRRRGSRAGLRVWMRLRLRLRLNLDRLGGLWCGKTEDVDGAVDCSKCVCRCRYPAPLAFEDEPVESDRRGRASALVPPRRPSSRTRPPIPSQLRLDLDLHVHPTPCRPSRVHPLPPRTLPHTTVGSERVMLCPDSSSLM
ncbi:hypothetical protein R3P38DRAFT_3238618 [Favolaschia claudopus]|uniref:Uncharacterized protein n=1 Tax=Favolaschia claudopus TaxID=2862362 RepID=A0AAV9Z918_9AGAR